MKSISYALNQLTYNESLPDGLTILLGSSGCGKTIFAEQYAYEILREGGKVIWVTTEELPSSLRTSMSKFGWNVEKFEIDGNLLFFDAVSPARLGFSENVGRGVLGLDPTGMLIVLSDQLKQEDTNRSKPFLVVLDSVSRLLLSCESKAVIDFVSCLNSRMENYRVKGFATIAEGAHDGRVLNAITFSSAAMLRFRINEEQNERTRQLRFETARGRQHDDRWKNYVITNSGIDMEV